MVVKAGAAHAGITVDGGGHQAILQAMQAQQAAIQGQQAAIQGQQAAIHGQQAAIQGQQATIQAQQAAIQGQQAVLQNMLLNTQLVMIVYSRNNRAHIKNSQARPSERLTPLYVERVGGAHPVGTLPATVNVVFPGTPSAVAMLTTAEINALEAFYGEQFAGQTLDDRRTAFALYIGVRMQ
ncbi:hypothetical protein HYH03_010757 [Edaphochlamys debaryana]|uniref:Uncharacterized protein n=1 Tax=Edaphochlamys debaryana TaxID=47281 RepID=A0A835XXJ4_9CHLO|nr:hypothetical protein HYH03_010757 [Edaphochlamys debaryana]|eukprot:KAG2490838.1 hypothetical protein HYH03_010757 [Edaphochlamys debaryana]